ncbi:Response regulator receiver domain-containing protein [Marivirga sericea]|uniref:Response regulator receiver domain-containing protein n=1 Tax=Marivirga sericea TaxID=1028 RepID=A0A1X7KPY5_9BACT|nr:response regulator [Marivirga sericea]SMG43453.1 Response regulator receiver domain-containing protein [Marivirga sericea]
MSLPKENLEVLIVDDDDMTVFLHEVHVKENNFHPSPKSFYNGRDVVDYLNTYFNIAQSYCILLDINMPILDGWEVMDEIIKNGMDKNVFVIILTSSINKADRIKAEKYNMVIDYVEKPLSLEHLNKIKIPNRN